MTFRPDDLITGGLVLGAASLKAILSVAPSLAQAELPIPAKDLAEFGSTVVLTSVVLYFIFRYLPRQEARQDAKDKMMWDMVSQVRKEDADRRHTENEKLHEGLIAISDEMRRWRESEYTRHHVKRGN